MAKRCLLDAIGVSLAASGLGEGCRAFIDLAMEQGGRPTCTVFGMDQRVPVEAAAFCNGALAHAMDYEDAHDGTLLHPNAQSIPAALAIAEALGPATGRDLISAIAVGCEVAVRMGLALRASMSDYGWYPPPILAAFGATAAASRLLHLGARQTRDALSLTLCQATCSGEIKYSPDSVMRAVRDAFGARAAVTSALLAARGVTGFDLPLEGQAGFFAMFARGAYEPSAILRDLGRSFEIDNISLKPWPSCRGTHAAIQGIVELRAEHGLPSTDVQRIELHGGRILRMLDEPLATKRHPATAIDAKFSLPFVCASALIHGRVTIDSFSAAALQAPETLRIAQKVSLVVDQDLPENSIGTKIVIATCRGTRHELDVSFPLGHPRNPMTEDASIGKFMDCARYAANPTDESLARRISEIVLRLELLEDVGSQLMPLLRGG